MFKKTKIVYVTSNKFKAEENKVFQQRCKLSDGTPVRDLFTFEIRSIPIKEILDVDLQAMVQAEVTQAYSQIKVPCIVEHAGLVFNEYKNKEEPYPGGLTKPMWNALKDKFLEETKSSGREAIARAVVAYCDGMSVQTFVGETTGKLATKPRGARKFYWDTVFIPNGATGKAANKTYAEIVAHSSLGLGFKIEKFSQSTKAMLKFLEYLRKNGAPLLWK
jgi:XTP/dITP diphosphohydrolase